MADFPSVDHCLEAAADYLRHSRGEDSDAQELGRILYLYRLEWDRRYEGSIGPGADLSRVPSIEEQAWECAQPIAELVDPDRDPLKIYSVLIDVLKSDFAAHAKAFRYERTWNKEIIEYD